MAEVERIKDSVVWNVGAVIEEDFFLSKGKDGGDDFVPKWGVSVTTVAVGIAAVTVVATMSEAVMSIEP